MKLKELFNCSKDVFKFLFILFFSMFLMLYLSEKIFKNIAEDLMFSLSLILALFIYYYIFKKNKENLFGYLGFKIINIKCLGVILLIGLLNFFFELTIISFLNTATSNTTSSFDLSNIFCLFHLIILAPFTEEILFRGIIFKRLKQSMNIYISIIIQAILFGLMHPGLLHVIQSMIFGILLAAIYHKFKNITMPMILHSVHNLLFVLLNVYLLNF